MEKGKKTLVEARKIEDLVLQSKLQAVAQAGYVKVSGAKGRNIYIARTGRVGRINLSGFTMKHPGVRDLGDLAFGSVSQEIDFERSEEEILDTVQDVLTELAALPAAEPRRRMAAGAASREESWTHIAQPARSQARGLTEDRAGSRIPTTRRRRVGKDER